MKDEKKYGKNERILNIYEQLLQGRLIVKREIAERYHVDSRSVQRDIGDIRNFLENRTVETGIERRVIYDSSQKGYRLENADSQLIECREVLVLCKVLLESRSLVRSELFPMIDKLLSLCEYNADYKKVAQMLLNEKYHYNELQHKKPLMKVVWDLSCAVNENRYVEIQYQTLFKDRPVARMIKPVGIMFSEFYFYLAAYIDGIDKEKEYENPDDRYPTIYRIDRIQEYTLLSATFIIPYRDRFEEGEFKKRVQFMYGGRLQRVQFLYTGPSVEAVLDRLPTAKIMKEEKGEYVISAEVFGKGVDMWIKSQGSYITEVRYF